MRAYLWDRKMWIATYMVCTGLAAAMFLLDKLRYEDQVDSGLVYYFVELSLVVLIAGLTVDYIRQRSFQRQLKEAAGKRDLLEASRIVQAGVTNEQKAMQRLLEAQYSACMTEIDRYRRQQERHNHFAMQWVHHMKTPISVIDLLLQEAQSKTLSQEEQALLLTSLQEENERLVRGLETMLHTARLDKFEIDVHIRSVPLHEIARNVINAHKKLCIRYAIYPRVEGEGYAETDEKWLAFVLNQLVNNAIKYSKRKPGSKKLAVQVSKLMDGAIRLSVTDEGIGIAAQDLPRVFDPFFTGENGRTIEESTGMGLYLAKQVCGRLGHELTVESEEGQGTRVSMIFYNQSLYKIAEAR
ncbi:sensor histidine kinase [Paenibacillus sp. NPDC058071]|uniref:sensor histidine kinase n=1 Tax=Paenibacillus sp. NPDC058071 TaxID=3346326 RepID=UPI0036DF8724